MSNVYDSASLILTPNAYKASKMYALKGSDISFSRSTKAMRRNSLGLWEEVAINIPRLHYPIGGGCPSWSIESEATNIILNSLAVASDFTAAGSATLSNNTMTTPFSGVTNAVKVTTSASFYSGCYKIISRGSAITTNWVVVKKGTLDWCAVFNSEASSPAWFNIANGTIGNVNSGNTARITDEGDGWYRCEISNNSAAMSSYSQIFFTDTNGSALSAIGDSYICFAQNEIGSISTSPILTTTAAVTRTVDIPSTIATSGVTKIVQVVDGTTTTITSIPSPYTIPNGLVSLIYFL